MHFCSHSLQPVFVFPLTVHGELRAINASGGTNTSTWAETGLMLQEVCHSESLHVAPFSFTSPYIP